MSVKNQIWFVFKVVMATVLLSTIIVFGTSVAIIFYGYSEIKTIGENMQAEMSKNNTLYKSSYVLDTEGGSELKGFSEQLMRIAERSRGAYRFNGISVKDAGVTNARDLLRLHYNETDGTYTIDINQEDAVGDYGDFRTIQIHYTVNFTFILPRGTQVNAMETQTSTSDVVFEFVAPCLRYLK